MLPREIETARLRLRAPRVQDAEAAYETWCSDPEVSRYMTWTTHASVGETRAFLEACVRVWEEGGGHTTWIVESREDARVLGMIGATLEAHANIVGGSAPHRASVGYALGRAHWGRGFASEGVRALVATLIAMPSIHRVYAVCDVDNVASARVMEKCGMSFEAVLRRWIVHPQVSSEPRDVRCHAIVR